MTPTDSTGEGLTIMMGGKVIHTIPLISPQQGRVVVRYHMVEIVHEPAAAPHRYAVERLDGEAWALLSDHEKLSAAASAFEAAQDSASTSVRLFDRQAHRVVDEFAVSGSPAVPSAPAAPYAVGVSEGAPDVALLPHLATESELLDALTTDVSPHSFDRIEIRAPDGTVLHALK